MRQTVKYIKEHVKVISYLMIDILYVVFLLPYITYPPVLIVLGLYLIFKTHDYFSRKKEIDEFYKVKNDVRWIKDSMASFKNGLRKHS